LNTDSTEQVLIVSDYKTTQKLPTFIKKFVYAFTFLNVLGFDENMRIYEGKKHFFTIRSGL